MAVRSLKVRPQQFIPKLILSFPLFFNFLLEHMPKQSPTILSNQTAHNSLIASPPFLHRRLIATNDHSANPK